MANRVTSSSATIAGNDYRRRVYFQCPN